MTGTDEQLAVRAEKSLHYGLHLIEQARAAHADPLAPPSRARAIASMACEQLQIAARALELAGLYQQGSNRVTGEVSNQDVINADRATRQLRKTDPRLVAWLAAGAPSIASEDDHIRWFGESYETARKRKGKR